MKQIICTVFGAIFWFAGCAASEKEVPAAHADLRVVGKVKSYADVTEDRTSAHILFNCESEEKAVFCASKYVADLLGFGNVEAEPDGRTFSLDDSCFWFIGTKNRTAHILIARVRSQLEQQVRKHKAEDWRTVPRNAYPKWFDRFDNAALGMGNLGWGTLPEDYREGFAWCFTNRMNIIGETPNKNMSVAPGLIDSSVCDFFAHMAKTNNLAYYNYLMVAKAEQPSWLWNKVPLPYVRGPENSIAHPNIVYQSIVSSAGFEPRPPADRLYYAAQREVARRAAADPNMETHSGIPEVGHKFVMNVMAYSETPSAKEAWRKWLREKCGYDLAAVGKLYAGDPARFKHWDEVYVPLLDHFAGWNPKTSLDLRGDWILRTGNGPETTVHCNDPALMMLRGFTNAVTLTRRISVADPSAFKYLHISRHAWHSGMNPLFSVTVNGRPLKDLTLNAPIVEDLDQCFELGDALRTGENTIRLDTGGQPVPYYIFLNGTGRWKYPSKNPELNQLYFDLSEFAADYRLRGVEEWIRAIRAGDPQGRPIQLMAPWDLVDLTFDLCRRYGVYPHDTGQGGSCWAPWMTFYYTTRGLPVSSEPGGPPSDALAMRQLVTLYLLLGNDSVSLLFDPTSYRDKPDVDSWIMENRELLRAIGKLNSPKADIGVLRSVRNPLRLQQRQTWSWDPSRGMLQSVGRSVSLVTPQDLAEDKVNDWFDVLMDAKTTLFTSAETEGLVRYVRMGGTFIAGPETGRDTPAETDVYGVPAAFGFSVREVSGGRIRFTEEQSLFPDLRGKELDCHGPCFEIVEHPEDVEVVAEWVHREPGKGRIALAVRKEGKGRFIFGSTFWDFGGDKTGKNRSGRSVMLGDLLDTLGVPRNSEGETVTGRSIFAERRRSKNGVYNVYLAARPERGDPGRTDTRLSFVCTEKPETVRELSAAGYPKVPFRFENARLELGPVPIEPMQIRLYGTIRNDVVLSPLFWLKTLEKRWYTLPEIPESELLPPEKPDPDCRGLNEGWTMLRTDDVWSGIRPEPVDWAQGRVVTLGAFELLGLEAEDVVRFRKVVTVPPDWKNKRVSLGFSSQYWFWGIGPKGRLWVNGEPAPVVQPLGGKPNGAFSFDVPSEGEIELVLEIDGRLAANQRRVRPSGVTGLFYLRAEPKIRKELVLNGFDRFDKLVGVRSGMISSGEKGRYLYLEKRFATPDFAKEGPVYLESSQFMGWVLINGHYIQPPGDFRRLDVSGLLKRDGSENLLRWWPGLCKEEPSWKRFSDERAEVPELKLVLRKED